MSRKSKLRALALVTFSSMLLHGSPVHASAREDWIRGALRDFDRDPARFLARLPHRFHRDGAPVSPGETHFTSEAVRSREFVTEKLAGRRHRFWRSRLLGFDLAAPYGDNDQAVDLVDELRVSSLGEIEDSKLTSARLDHQPWSSDYWPVYSGEIAKRYASDEWLDSSDWKKNFAHFTETTSSTSVDQLSPAEKYDLLIGDSDQTLTKAMWGEGRKIYERLGKVERWMGLCHGWAPASYMMPRPEHAITLLAADGHTEIPFLPSDIKALATLLWANGHASTRFIGGRCNSKNPRTNPNGRLLDPECFDTNPGTWHLSVVNQIGVGRRSFVMDATYDYQVWNQPVLGYRYTYFNPRTREPARSMAEATVRLDRFDNDKFHEFRSSEAAQVVGVAMDVTYVAENPPVRNTLDSEASDNLVTVTYLYDLELDARGRILGGEWYANAHPDFLWTPEKDAHATTEGDFVLDRAAPVEWEARKPVPELWRAAAATASARATPLGHIVERLVTLSNAGL